MHIKGEVYLTLRYKRVGLHVHNVI